MKKSILSLMILLGLVTSFFACKEIKEQSESILVSKTAREENQAEILQAYKISPLRATIIEKPISQQREIFVTLPKKEKVEVMKNKLLQVIQLKQYTEAQRTILWELYSKVSEDIYEPTEEKAKELALYEQELKKKMVNVFQHKELALACTMLIDLSVDTQTNTLVPAKSQDNDELVVAERSFCECNKMSDWCFYGFACKSPCSWPTTGGCGTWMNQGCNGACVSVGPILE